MPWILTPLLLGLTIAGDKPSTGEVVVLKHCEITYERTTTLGAFVILQAGGRLQDCYVQPGDRVKKGQMLARLHDRDAVVELERLRSVSESDIDVRLGEAKQAVALAKLKRAESLLVKALVSIEEVQLDRLDVKTATLEIEQARRRRCSDALSTRRMEAEVRSRELVAPHDGVVVEIMKNVGESCICNEAVMRIVADDRVHVTGFLDVGDAWKVRLGHRVRMFVKVEGAEVPIEREVFLGRVIFVDPRIDPMNRTCQVVAEIENRGQLLRSGLDATLEIDLAVSWKDDQLNQQAPAASLPKPPQGCERPIAANPESLPRSPSR